MQKQMALGEQFVVPATVQGPLIWTARPDALRITIGGRVVPPLADRQMTIKDVPVSAAALLARPPATASPVPAPAAQTSTDSR
jgi:cytoskeleton protein RodZ